MRKAFFDCTSGAAGDMLLASVLDVLRLESSDPANIEAAAAPWGECMHGLLACEENGRFSLERVIRGGMAALKIDFYAAETHADHHHHHHHRHFSDIKKLLEAEAASGSLSEDALSLGLKIFRILAEAEGTVHGCDPETVHFHEVGAFDSIMDIAGFAEAFTRLQVTQTAAMPVTLGSGSITAAHGIMAVPPPAVVEILRSHEIPSSDIELPGECLTPTGAAILAAIVDEWSPTPKFKKIIAQGVGAGTREIAEKANVVRMFYGE